MTITATDIYLLLPLLLVTGTVVVAMTAIGIKRDYTSTAIITISGFLIAAIAAAALMPGTNQQVTPLLTIDQYSLFFTVVTCASAVFIAILSYPYLLALDDNREEYYLLLGVATVGGVVMVSATTLSARSSGWKP